MIARRILLFVVALFFAPAAAAEEKLAVFAKFDAASARVVDYGAWDAFLGRYVSDTPDGRTVVDYAAVSGADRAALGGYIAALEGVDPTTLSRNEAFAFWANLYNARTVKFILDHYPLKSILGIRSGLRPGPWRRTAVAVNGVGLSLDDIEHGILRKHWSDNRVHYAVNCASVGCPNLPKTAFRAATLDEMLDAGARAYVNHRRGAHFDGEGVVLSSIYKWYIEDFGGDEAGVIKHLQQFAEPEFRQQLSSIKAIARYEYDWDLNDVGS